tara:strand:- start:1668 stop:2207 length:540 start_codon:yes stop_codon:yes gene_type:complete
MAMRKIKFEVGQKVIRKNSDAGSCVIGGTYVVSQLLGGGAWIKVKGKDVSFNSRNFDLAEALILEQGKYYEFSDNLDFSKTTVAKFIIDLCDHIEDNEIHPYPLTVWSEQCGIDNYKYAREQKLVSLKVGKHGLMVTVEEAAEYATLVRIRYEDRCVADESAANCVSAKSKLLSKYCKE